MIERFIPRLNIASYFSLSRSNGTPVPIVATGLKYRSLVQAFIQIPLFATAISSHPNSALERDL
jgi:hypothetical protein